MAKENFYKKLSLTADFQKFDFEFESDHILIVHDGTGNLVMSWDGKTATNDGDIFSFDAFIEFNHLQKSKIFIKTSNPTDVVRVWAWRSEK